MYSQELGVVRYISGFLYLTVVLRYKHAKRNRRIITLKILQARQSIKRELFSILLGTRGVGSLLLLLLDELSLDHNLDLLADDPLAIKHHVERHAEVLPVDLAFSAVADPVAHHRVIEFPIPHYVQRHRLGVALDGQVAGRSVAILSGRFDPVAFECDRRILVDLQKIRRP